MRSLVVAILASLFLLQVALCSNFLLRGNEDYFEEADSLAKQLNLKVASFNIQVFGLKKLDKPSVVESLLNILSRYDFCLIQEIRDSSETAIFTLLQLLNAKTGKKYAVSVSPRLGRSNSKEQYGFLYDTAKVRVIKAVQFEDAHNWFERAPYSVFIQPTTVKESDASAMERTVFISAVHIRPAAVPQEMDHMHDMYQHFLTSSTLSKAEKDVVANRWILMGDLNAGCGYLSKKGTALLKLRSATVTLPNGQQVPQFSWLIKDDDNTTVAPGSSCPYDRFIVTDELSEAPRKPNSAVRLIGKAGTFNFEQEYHMTNAQAAQVSDHFPIEMQLQFN